MTTLSNLLNDLTGYTPLLKLKHELDTLSTQLATASTRLSSLRQTHNSLHSRRASHLRETNALLSRKDSWTPADLERFTSLYRAEHALEADVAAASEALARAEAQQDRLRAKVDLALLTRYHEEQIWSDKIRRLGSWTAVGLFALNLALWAVNLFGVEPWRRRKLVAGFEEKVESALDERLGELTRLAMVAVDSEGDVTTGRPTETAAPAEETLPAGPEQQQPAATAPATLDVKAANGALLDGLSGHDGDRVVSVTLGTMSALVLEGALTGAVAGAAVASTIFLLRRTA